VTEGPNYGKYFTPGENDLKFMRKYIFIYDQILFETFWPVNMDNKFGHLLALVLEILLIVHVFAVVDIFYNYDESWNPPEDKLPGFFETVASVDWVNIPNDNLGFGRIWDMLRPVYRTIETREYRDDEGRCMSPGFRSMNDTRYFSVWTLHQSFHYTKNGTHIRQKYFILDFDWSTCPDHSKRDRFRYMISECANSDDNGIYDDVSCKLLKQCFF
jgi:hypothetical protein